MKLEEYSAAATYTSARIEDLLIQESKQNSAGTMVACRNLDFIMYIRNPSNEPEKHVEHFLDYLHQQLTDAFSAYNFYWGISEISLKTPEFPQLYQNAVLALQYCMNSNSTQYRFTYRDTKEAQIVSALSNNEKCARFQRNSCSPFGDMGATLA